MTDINAVDLGRNFTVTNEYLSLTALLGDVFKELERQKTGEKGLAFLFPQTEGAEVDGQYSRLLRTKLNQEGYKKVDIVAPFLEDGLHAKEDDWNRTVLGLLAGDVIRNAPPKSRQVYLRQVIDSIKNGRFDMNFLITITRKIREEWAAASKAKSVLVIGEPMLLYNDFLNDFIFNTMENQGVRVVYGALSEALWLFWSDYVNQNPNQGYGPARQRLAEFAMRISEVSAFLRDESPFEKEPGNLVTKADATIGFYAGAFGRYRQAKALSELPCAHGIISVASSYENTGISLSILHKDYDSLNSRPVLNLIFDGNQNENDRTKIESFLYYLNGKANGHEE